MVLTLHGINNLIENGYYLLYRENYVGPLRFVYEGVGGILGLSARDAGVVYTFVDLGLSLNAMLSYRLADDAQRLYRYVNADLLWGMKQRGIKYMTLHELLVEVVGDVNTLFGQSRSYK